MTTNTTTAQARRIITGVDEHGRSCFVADEDTPVRLSSDANTKCDIWRTGTLPVSVDDGDGLKGAVYMSPDAGGLVYRIVTFRPDSEWDMSKGFSDANGPLDGMIPPQEAGGIVGLHVTDTVDIVTVLSGELTAVTETEETTLYPGDTLVQRGTKHTWNNRTNEPATAAVLMVSATRK
jgi:mannose-6-phosphate isomerase-like protein (cupin superfamily)